MEGNRASRVPSYRHHLTRLHACLPPPQGTGRAPLELYELQAEAGAGEGARAAPFSEQVGLLCFRMAQRLAGSHAEAPGLRRRLLQRCLAMLTEATAPTVWARANVALGRALVHEARAAAAAAEVERERDREQERASAAGLAGGEGSGGGGGGGRGGGRGVSALAPAERVPRPLCASRAAAPQLPTHIALDAPVVGGTPEGALWADVLLSGRLVRDAYGAAARHLAVGLYSVGPRHMRGLPAGSGGALSATIQNGVFFVQIVYIPALHIPHDSEALQRPLHAVNCRFPHGH